MHGLILLFILHGEQRRHMYEYFSVLQTRSNLFPDYPYQQLGTTPRHCQNISSIQNAFKDSQLPILEQIAGSPGAAYSNEADSLEEDFKTTFFGPNYPRLEDIKRRYDPKDMFIVAAGAGSDKWDKDGLCRVD